MESTPPQSSTADSSSTSFYDPSADDKNDDWALKERQGRKSDAVLSCPACLTTLCIDCQRHEFHVNQYRAMFVRNCTVVETERLRYAENKKRKRNRRRESKGGSGMVRVDPKDAVGIDEETFKPVRCSECGAQVAVIDSDEVYHFFDFHMEIPQVLLQSGTYSMLHAATSCGSVPLQHLTFYLPSKEEQLKLQFKIDEIKNEIQKNL